MKVYEVIEKNSMKYAHEAKTLNECIYRIPLYWIINAGYSPFNSPPWMEGRITKSMALRALRNEEFESLPYTGWMNKNPNPYTPKWHARRVAYLVKHKASDPLIFDRTSSGGIRFEDGNHRLAAAIIREDDTIDIYFPGDFEEMYYFFHFDEIS